MEGFGSPHWQLRRNNDPETSHEAAEEVDSEKWQREVFEVIRSFGEEGCISEQVLEHFGFFDQRENPVAYSGVTGCWAPLERKFFIERRGAKRKSARFGKWQYVMHALPAHETIRRQNALDEAMRQAATDENLALLVKWSKMQEVLIATQATELALRKEVLGRMFPDVVTGKYRVPLHAGYELIAQFLSRETRLTIEKMSERRKRQLERGAIESGPNYEDSFDDTRWNDEHNPNEEA